MNKAIEKARIYPEQYAPKNSLEGKYKERSPTR
jgi:hypothetical protein